MELPKVHCFGCEQITYLGVWVVTRAKYLIDTKSLIADNFYSSGIASRSCSMNLSVPVRKDEVEEGNKENSRSEHVLLCLRKCATLIGQSMALTCSASGLNFYSPDHCYDSLYFLPVLPKPLQSASDLVQQITQASSSLSLPEKHFVSYRNVSFNSHFAALCSHDAALANYPQLPYSLYPPFQRHMCP